MCCCLNNVDGQLPRLKSHAAADRSAALQRPCQHPLQVIRSSTGHVQASTLRNQPEKTKFPSRLSRRRSTVWVLAINQGERKQLESSSESRSSPQALLISETHHQSVTSMKVGNHRA